jgi:acetyl esterase
MALDPQIKALLDFLASAGAPPMHEGTPDEARGAFRALAVDARPPAAVVPVGSTEDLTIPAADGAAIPARVYRPEQAGPAPTVVLLHGGGWVIGDLDTHDNLARSLCRDCAAVVVSVDYRLAPEARFPAAVEDAIAATRWAGEHLAELGGNDVLAVAGDSAGGNLAAVVAHELRDRPQPGVPALAAQLLIYPATDVLGDYASRTDNGEGYFLDLPTMGWFMEHYVGDAQEAYADPRVSPLRAESLADLPPAVVVTAEFDPLRDEGEAYADALRAAGVKVEVRRFDGLIHGFIDMGPHAAAAQQAVDETCAMFATLLR